MKARCVLILPCGGRTDPAGLKSSKRSLRGAAREFYNRARRPHFSRALMISARSTAGCALLVGAVVLGCQAASGGLTNTIPRDLFNPAVVWGAEANGFCAGVFCGSHRVGESTTQILQVFVLTSKTNAEWNYVSPPGQKFARFDITDPKGAPLKPRWRRALAADAPPRIRVEDLPRRPETGRSGRLLEGWFLPQAGMPTSLRPEITIQDTTRFRRKVTTRSCSALLSMSSARIGYGSPGWICRASPPGSIFPHHHES
jgi:hypothetical protein